jgi:hypothetical protein
MPIDVRIIVSRRLRRLRKLYANKSFKLLYFSPSQKLPDGKKKVKIKFRTIFDEEELYHSSYAVEKKSITV